MSPFLRFIVSVVVLGVLVNLSIVMIANGQSARTQEKGRQAELATFKEILESVNGRGRRAHIVVESQELSWKGDVTRSSLLIRRHFLTGNPILGENSSSDSRLPLMRVVIDGDKLWMDGLVLDFGPNFHVDVDGHQMMRGMKIAYFAHVHGMLGGAEDWFSFVQGPDIPELTRIYPAPRQATFFELQLWLHIWDLVSNDKWAATADLKARYTPAAAITVKNGHLYSAYLDTNGIALEEDTNPRLLSDILNEAAVTKDKKATE